MEIKEIIAKVASCNDKESFDATIESIKNVKSIPATVIECIKNIVNAAKPETPFAATKIRVINSLQVLEITLEFAEKNKESIASTSSEQEQIIVPLQNQDHETALKEVTNTIQSYIHNTSDQIERYHSLEPKNRKTENIIGLIHGICELLDNPEHAEYIEPSDIIEPLIKLQLEINKISVLSTYRPLDYLLKLLPDKFDYNNLEIRKQVLVALVYTNPQERIPEGIEVKEIRDLCMKFPALISRTIQFIRQDNALLNNFFAPNSIGNTPLHSAAKNGYTESVKVILAAAKDNPDLLKTLLAPNSNGETPMHLAAKKRDTESVKAILAEAKDKPDLLKTLLAPNSSGNTPLHWAATNGNTESVKAILAAAKDNPDLLKILLAPNIYGNTPLHLAEYNGYTESVKVILAAVKDNPELLKTLLAPNGDGNTPLHLAAKKGHTESVEILLPYFPKLPQNLMKCCSTDVKALIEQYGQKASSATGLATSASSSSHANVTIAPAVTAAITNGRQVADRRERSRPQIDFFFN